MLQFTADGLLPPGDYPMTFAQLRTSLLVEGPPGRGPDEPWDAAWRAQLVDRAEVLVRQLWDAGLTTVFLDGSFVEDKAHPNDIDGYFECGIRELATGDLQQRLNQRDPHRVWTWDPASRRAYRGYVKKQLPMWHAYRVELYPHARDFTVRSGIVDEHGVNLPFPAAFRRSRASGRQKGIVRLIP